MSLNILIVFVLGLLAGWLIEWIIDRVYLRRRKPPSSPTDYKPQSRTFTGKPLSKKQLNARVEDLTSVYPALGDALKTMVAHPDLVEKTPEAVASDVQANLAGWFDDVMDRSSGDYKRKASKWAWLIGTLLAFVFNVDSIEIATRLWREPTVRQVIVAQAENYRGSDGQDSFDDLSGLVEQLGVPIGWTTVPPQDGQQCGWMPGQAVYPSVSSDGTCQILLNLPRMDDGWGWLQKLFGLLISGIAAAQGAPFWYDVLKKVVNFRSTGGVPKSTRSQNSGSE